MVDALGGHLMRELPRRWRVVQTQMVEHGGDFRLPDRCRLPAHRKHVLRNHVRLLHWLLRYVLHELSLGLHGLHRVRLRLVEVGNHLRMHLLLDRRWLLVVLLLLQVELSKGGENLRIDQRH